MWDVDRRFDPLETDEFVRTMTDSLRHRGPDGEGLWADDATGIVLGHRRLAVVDLTDAGHQPMCSRDGRWVISYNGEVYDHRIIRRELESAGVVFRGHSDTEVLVEAFAEWGIGATLRRIDGMFAVALWDKHERKLHLIRDRFGEKPLSYGFVQGAFVFASETRSFRSAFPGRLELDPQAINAFLRFRAIPAPLSIHKGISKLVPGAWLTITADGSVSEQRWFEPWRVAERRASNGLHCSDDLELKDRVEAALVASVSDRVEADVPVGVFLSGGIDSSLIAALATSASSKPVQTFTIGFTEAGFDESPFAARIAKYLGTNHTQLLLQPQEAMDAIPRAIAAYDEPFADSSQIPTLLVSELARRDVTVALGGDGGDEFFGGYNRHRWIPSAWPRIARIPSPIRSAASGFVGAIPPGLIDRFAELLPVKKRPRQLGLKLSKIGGTLGAESPEALWLGLVSHWLDPASITGRPETYEMPGFNRSELPIADVVALADIAHYLPTDILTKVDRASMATSLEVRSPFLAREVTDLAWQFPMARRAGDGVPKKVLQDVLARHVPVDLWQRPKSGFGIPLGQWLAGPLAEWVDDRLAALGDGVLGLDESVIRQTWAQARAVPAGPAPYLVWDLVVFAEWLDQCG